MRLAIMCLHLISGYVLQQNNNLETTSWITVTNTPTITNLLDQLILSPTNNQEFYRLVYP